MMHAMHDPGEYEEKMPSKPKRKNDMIPGSSRDVIAANKKMLMAKGMKEHQATALCMKCANMHKSAATIAQKVATKPKSNEMKMM